MGERPTRPTPDESSYEAPALVTLGTVHELTLHCDKMRGQSDGFTFMGDPIVCTTTSV